MIYERLQRFIEEDPSTYPSYLSDPLRSWTNRHYVLLSEIVGISESSIKRLFEYSGHAPSSNLNTTSKNRLMLFLGFKDWKSLEDELIVKASDEL